MDMHLKLTQDSKKSKKNKLLDALSIREIRSPLALEQAATESQVIRESIIIYFVEGTSNGGDMMGLMEDYKSVRELTVDLGDPNHLVEDVVGQYLRMRKRITDRYRVYLPPDVCYAVATIPENRNTLFLIPDVDVAVQEIPEGEQAESSLDDRDMFRSSPEMETQLALYNERECQLTALEEREEEEEEEEGGGGGGGGR